MPNWCTNIVTITGPADEVTRLADEVATPYTDPSREDSSEVTGDFLLWNMVRPTAEDLAERDRIGWYDWNIAHFGTKWENTGDCRVRDSSPGTRVYDFATAWSPPIPALGALAARYPQVTIEATYDEPGNDFSGIATWSNGQLLSHDEHPSTNRWCEVCEESYQVDWTGDGDTGCPQDTGDPDGDLPERAHLAADPTTDPARLHAALARTLAKIPEAGIGMSVHDDEHWGIDPLNVLAAFAQHPHLDRDSRCQLATHPVPAVRYAALTGFTRSDLDALAADPERAPIATAAVVAASRT